MVAAAPVLSAGIIYEADFFDAAIYAISSTGTKTQLAGNLNTPYEMALSNSGDLYYSEVGGGITKINHDRSPIGFRIADSFECSLWHRLRCERESV